jgi:CDP-2,3-bis-(O-geranylgeranyl)-sn-glycerol synthase
MLNDISQIGLLVLQSLWLIAPAYAANAFPPVLKGRNPVDNGKKIGKYRILGDGKTIEGTLGGIAFGIFFGFIQRYFFPLLPDSLGLMEMSIPLIILLSMGAILGDMVNSFFKRRFGVERGERVSIINRLDFLFGALLLAYVGLAIMSYPLSVIRWEYIIILIVITPIMHKLANLLAFALNIKKVPY